MPASVLSPEPVSPESIHNCPSCGHWLPDGTLACPDCQTLTYGQHLSRLAGLAQNLERQQKWKEAREQWRATLQWLPGETRQAESIQQHIAQLDGRVHAEEDQRTRWVKRLGPLAPIALFLLKAKSAVFLLFKLKFLLGIFGFFGLYWVAFGWKFAVGFTASLFIHEMGHFVAVKRRGLQADLPIFFPGLGAYVRWYGMGVSREDLAAIALAGPLYGLAASLACLALAWGTHSMFWMMLANVGAWINFFNLLPVFGLDGAQATYALSRMQRSLIAATCFIFFGLTWSGDLFGPRNQWVFFFVGLGMAWRCFTDDVPERADTKTFGYFQALVVVLGFLLCVTQVPGLR